MRELVIDTNVLVYAEDAREPLKRGMARALLRQLRSHARVILPSQVVSEFANTMLRLGSAHEHVGAAVENLGKAYLVVPITPGTVSHAVHGVSRFGFSFYDAQIWAAAREWGATIVLSEHFTDGMVADGVRFVNPFAEEFEPDAFLGSLD